jgi:hypothetical protein
MYTGGEVSEVYKRSESTREGPLTKKGAAISSPRQSCNTERMKLKIIHGIQGKRER